MWKNLTNLVIDRTVTRILIDVQPIAEVVYDRIVDRYGHNSLLRAIADVVDTSDVASRMNHEEVASYLNPNSIAASIDTDAITEAIAESIDTSEIVDRLDTYAIAAEVAKQVDWTDHVPSAEEVAPLVIDRLDLAALAEQVAERIDHEALAERVAERTGRGPVDVPPSAGLIDRLLDRAVDRLLAAAEEAAERGDV